MRAETIQWFIINKHLKIYCFDRICILFVSCHRRLVALRHLSQGFQLVSKRALAPVFAHTIATTSTAVKSPRVLVTGAMGQLGNELILQLRKQYGVVRLHPCFICSVVLIPDLTLLLGSNHRLRHSCTPRRPSYGVGPV